MRYILVYRRNGIMYSTAEIYDDINQARDAAHILEERGLYVVIYTISPALEE